MLLSKIIDLVQSIKQYTDASGFLATSTGCITLHGLSNKGKPVFEIEVFVAALSGKTGGLDGSDASHHLWNNKHAGTGMQCQKHLSQLVLL